MPVFDFECKNCGNVYEELVMSGSTPDSEIECPKCGQRKSTKRMSAPSIGAGGSGSSLSSGAGCGSGGFT